MGIEIAGAVPKVGIVEVATTNNGGFPVEHWTERLLEKIVHVAEDSASPIKDQALVFKDDIREAIRYYMQLAVNSDRTTLCAMLTQRGETEMAEIIRRLN